MNILQTLFRVLFPASLDEVFSDESKERTALGIAARFSRGNISIQNARVTTIRMFAEEMNRMIQRVSREHAPSR